MKMDGEENWIDAEIERELATLTDDGPDVFEEDVDVSTDIPESNELDSLMRDYENRARSFVDSVKNQLNDVELILGSETKTIKKNYYDEDVHNAAKSCGLDVDTFSKQILLDLEAEEAKEDEILETQPEERKPEDGPEGAVSGTIPDSAAEPGALIEFCESHELERKFREQMNEWTQRQREKENARLAENEQYYCQIKERLEALEMHQKTLLDSMRLEVVSLEKVKTLRAAEMDIESREVLVELKEEEVQHEEALKKLENERINQKKYMEELRSQAESIENAKKHKAATKIQSLWRAYQTRQEYGDTVREWIQHGKKKREEKRVREIENERVRREAVERKRIEEEQKEIRRLEMERLKEEEKHRLEEKERLKKIEEEKIEAERRRQRKMDEEKKEVEKKKRELERERKLEEEKKRMLEEERRAKEAIRVEEERKLKEEAERKKTEEERIAVERKSREEAGRRRLEERRLEELKKIEEEKRKLEEIERSKESSRKKEEEQRRNEEERKAEIEKLTKLEEQKKMEQEAREEEKRKREEERKKADLEKKILAEEKELERLAIEKFNQKFGSPESKKSKSEKHDDSSVKTSEMKVNEVPEPTTPTHAELIQKGRLAWMQSCIPLSKLLMEAKSRKPPASTIPKRRLSSSKKLVPLPDSLVFSDGLSDSYEEVNTLKLEKLPAHNFHKLTMCINLTMVEIQNCKTVVLDAFETCRKLSSLICKNSKVEVVNLKNLQELVYLDLSENQISSIHGLDGCTGLCHLDLHKNRITRVENLCHLINLHTLNLGQNSISRTNNISEVPTMQQLNLSRNNIRRVIELDKLPLLNSLDLSFNSLESVPVLTNHVLLERLYLQNNCLANIDALGVFWLPLLKELNLANNSIETFPKMVSTICLETLDLSENAIGDSKDLLPNLGNCSSLVTLTVLGNPVVQLIPNLRDLVKTAIPWLRNIDGFAVKAKRTLTDSSELFELCTAQFSLKKRLDEAYDKYLKSFGRKEPELMPFVRKQFFEKSHKMAADFRYAHEYGDLTTDSPADEFFLFRVESMSLRSETPVPIKTKGKPELQDLSMSNVTDARSKFEMALGGKSLNVFEKLVEETAKSTQSAMKRNLGSVDEAAVKIQAFWRGFLCRKRLALACNFANLDLEYGSFDEIDIDAWNLDEAALEQEWRPSDVPRMVSNSPVLGPIQLGQPKEAWSHLTAKPPQSPALSELETSRTKTSKSEQLTEEWGFKDSRTADMMLRRAKKLKYDAQKRKRLSQLDPKQRLILLRKLEETAHLPTVQPPRRSPLKRTDYFLAREKEVQQERAEKAAENSNKINRMYEWLSTAADVGSVQDVRRTTSSTVGHKPPIGVKRADWGGSDSRLPKLGPSKMPRSPGSDHMSIQSIESDPSVRRFSLDGVVGRTPAPFPPIKNTSAPTAQRKPSPDPGSWGGGRKRNAKRLS